MPECLQVFPLWDRHTMPARCVLACCMQKLHLLAWIPVRTVTWRDVAFLSKVLGSSAARGDPLLSCRTIGWGVQNGRFHSPALQRSGLSPGERHSGERHGRNRGHPVSSVANAHGAARDAVLWISPLSSWAHRTVRTGLGENSDPLRPEEEASRGAADEYA